MPWPKGRPKSDEQRKKLSNAQKGKKLTEEHRAKIAAATKARWERKDPKLIAAREAGTEARRLPVGTLMRLFITETKTKRTMTRTTWNSLPTRTIAGNT